jgi:hypothetical protein
VGVPRRAYFTWRRSVKRMSCDVWRRSRAISIASLNPNHPGGGAIERWSLSRRQHNREVELVCEVQQRSERPVVRSCPTYDCEYY